MEKRKIIKYAVINGVSLLLLAAALIASALLRGTLLPQRAAEAWRGDSEERFAQVSCFFPEGAALGEMDVYSFRQSLDAKLVEASLEAPEGGSLWTDAYCAQGELNVVSEKSSATVTAIGVGGDFFLFHPLRLRSGAYLSGDALMKDLVVLDEELAWKLFGAYDIAGMSVTIGTDSYLIAGVVAREDDSATKAAYPGGACIYLSYSAFLKNLPDAGITCYETAMPDPVTGFAYELVKAAFSAGDTVQNTDRFSFSASLKQLGRFGERSMRLSAVKYPYWENAARYIEDWLALLAVLTLLFCVCPAVTVVIIAVRLFRELKRRWGSVRKAVSRLMEKRRTRGYVPSGPDPLADEDDADEAAPEPYEPAGDDMEYDIAAIVSEVLEEQDAGAEYTDTHSNN